MIAAAQDPSRDTKKKKKSFWFEFAEEKGVNPHKSAWADYEHSEKIQENQKSSNNTRYCTQCGAQLQRDAKFCERCGHKIRR